MLAGTLLSKYGKYKPLHAVSFALASLAFGLLTMLDRNTTTVAFVWFELIAAAGMGMIMSVLLPAIMAPLPESYVASSSATYSFVRSFGYIWGITIASLTFNSVVDRNVHTVSDPSIQSQLRSGAAYAYASKAHTLRTEVDPVVWGEVMSVYEQSFRAIWWACVAISILSFFAVAFERSIKMRDSLETEYGLEKEKNVEENVDKS